MTSRHATLHFDRRVFISTVEQLGTCMSFHAHHSSNDVDIFKIDEQFRSKLCACLHPANGQAQHCNLFKGSIGDLYGRHVLKYQNFNREASTTSSATGKILSKAKHKMIERFMSDPDAELYVEGLPEGRVFGKRGESGTAVAVYGETGAVEIVAIIQGGSSANADLSGYTRCMFVPRMVSHLQGVYKKIFDLFVYQPLNCTDAVHFGDTILFTPDQIVIEDFDLCDKIVQLFGSISFDNATPERLEFIQSKERELSTQLNDRQYIETKDDNSAEQGALFNSMLACQFIYDENYRECEKHFKMTCRHIGKAKEFGLRILFKMITYVLFLYCNTDDKTNHRKLLTEVRKILNEDDDITKSNGFPRERLGYISYEYARFYRKDLNRKCGLDESHCAVTEFKKAHDASMSSDTANRLVLAICENIDILLWVGKSTDEEISVNDIEDARKKIQLVEAMRNKHKIATVQEVEYLICRSDLAFRQGKLSEGFRFANYALSMSKDAKIIASQKHAETRLSIISSMQQWWMSKTISCVIGFKYCLR